MTWMPHTRTPLGRRRAPPPTKNKRAPGTHCQNCQNTRPPRGPAGCAIAAEMEERRLDIAERNILEALTTDDPRMRMASAMITVRYSAKARKHGWIINSSASVDANAVAAAQLRHYRVVWSKPERELAAGEFVRDGRILSTPSYGGDRRDDDVFEDELAPPAQMIEHEAATAEPAAIEEPEQHAPRSDVRRRPLRARADRRVESQPPHRLAARILFRLS